MTGGRAALLRRRAGRQSGSSASPPFSPDCWLTRLPALTRSLSLEERGQRWSRFWFLLARLHADGLNKTKRCRRFALPPQSKIAAFLRNAAIPTKTSWSAPAKRDWCRSSAADGAFGSPTTLGYPGATEKKHSRASLLCDGTLAGVSLWLWSILFLALSAGAQITTNDLPALAPPAAPIPPTIWEQHEAAIIIGVLAIFVLGSLFFWNLLRPVSAVVVPPGQTARGTLAELASGPEDGRLLSDVSRILRRYLVATFALPPEEVTTAEFCAGLAVSHRVGEELAARFSGFLRECDQRKFSPEPAAAALNAVNVALELIALAEARRDAPASAAPLKPVQAAT